MLLTASALHVVASAGGATSCLGVHAPVHAQADSTVQLWSCTVLTQLHHQAPAQLTAAYCCCNRRSPAPLMAV